MDRLLNRLPLPTSITQRLRRLWKDEDLPLWQKRLVKGFKYSFVLKAIFWSAMAVHLGMKFFLQGDDPRNETLEPSVFSIVVITRNQPNALDACLKSLADADYGQDKVNLSIWIISVLGLFTSFDTETVRIADEFLWTHGEKTAVKFGQALGDSSGLWPNAFSANFTDDQLLFVHDSILLSPAYYRWLRKIKSAYGFDPEKYRVAGISMESISPQWKDGKKWVEADLDHNSGAFAYSFLPDVATFAPNVNIWKEFGQWLEMQQNLWFNHPALSGIEDLSGYSKSEANKHHWSLWFSQFLHEYGMYVVYPNIEEQRALTIRNKSHISQVTSAVQREKALLMDVNHAFALEKQNLSYVSVYDRKTSVDCRSTVDRTLTTLIAAETKNLVVASVSNETTSDIVANWLCSLSTVTRTDFRVLLFVERGSSGVDLYRQWKNVHVSLIDGKTTDLSVCTTALDLLRFETNVVFADVHQVWNRSPLALLSGALQGYDFGAALNSHSTTMGTTVDLPLRMPENAGGTPWVAAMTTLRSRLVMHSICNNISNSDQGENVTFASALNFGLEWKNRNLHGLSLRDLSKEITSIDSASAVFGTRKTLDFVAAVVDGVQKLPFADSLQNDLFLRWDTSTNKCKDTAELVNAAGVNGRRKTHQPRLQQPQQQQAPSERQTRSQQQQVDRQHD